MEELDKEEQLEVLNKLGIEKSSKVLDLMDNDDLALLLNEFSPEKKDSLLSGMKIEESKAVTGYHELSARNSRKNDDESVCLDSQLLYR